jgi:hypothetical protein
MEREEPDFDEQDSGVPVTSPDRDPDPLGPEHSVPGEPGGRDAGGGPAAPHSPSGPEESSPTENA